MGSCRNSEEEYGKTDEKHKDPQFASQSEQSKKKIAFQASTTQRKSSGKN
jgi:hypothetical protein